MSELISGKARIGANVTIGPHTVVHDHVVIGDNTVIQGHCEIGVPFEALGDAPLVIGESSVIRSHSILYQGSTFGAQLQTGHGVLIREKTIAGRNLRVGSQTDIEGHATFGDYVRVHSQVHVAQLSRVGHLAWLYPRVTFTNDPFPPSLVERGVEIGDLAVVATAAVILPGVRVGLGSFVGAGSVVRMPVPDVHCASGNPAEIFARLDRFVSYEHGLRGPWPSHFRAGYPAEAGELMDRLVAQIEAALRAS